MTRSEQLLANRERALVARFGFGKLVLFLVDDCQIVERGRIDRVLGAEPLLREGFELLRFDQSRGIVSGRKQLVVALLNGRNVASLRARRRGRHAERKRQQEGRHSYSPPDRHRVFLRPRATHPLLLCRRQTWQICLGSCSPTSRPSLEWSFHRVIGSPAGTRTVGKTPWIRRVITGYGVFSACFHAMHPLSVHSSTPTR